jgi:hypothetical protein
MPGAHRQSGVVGEERDALAREDLDRESAVNDLVVCDGKAHMARNVKEDVDRDLTAWNPAVREGRVVGSPKPSNTRGAGHAVQDCQGVVGTPSRVVPPRSLEIVEFVDHRHRHNQFDLIAAAPDFGSQIDIFQLCQDADRRRWCRPRRCAGRGSNVGTPPSWS